MNSKSTRTITLENPLVRIMALTGLVLLVPLTAQLFTKEMNWDETDYLVMGVLVFGLGLAYEVLTRLVDKSKRWVVAGGLGLLFLWLWAEMAVGVFTNWGS